MRSCTHKSEKSNDLEEVLRARGTKLQKGRRIIDRLISINSGKIVKNNPEKKYHRDHPDLQSLEHYSQSQFSVDSDSIKLRVPARALPRIRQRIPSKEAQQKQKQKSPSLLFDENAALVERAKQFVNRLRKQKQYDWGKVMIHRKKEAQMKQQKMKVEEQQMEKQKAFFKIEKYNKMIKNIMYHQEKISHRVRKSINRHKNSYMRYNTDISDYQENKRVTRSAAMNYQTAEETRSDRVVRPLLVSLKKRVAKLSRMVDSLQI